MVRTVLLPTDGSPAARIARDHAFEYARRYDGQVHAVHVVDASLATSQPTREALERRGDDVLDDVWQAGADQGFDVETALLAGVPHEEILAYADEQGVDTVVMGTHGHTGLDRLVLGSTTERVLRAADVPVLTVRRDGRGRPTTARSSFRPTAATRRGRRSGRPRTSRGRTARRSTSSTPRGPTDSAPTSARVPSSRRPNRPASRPSPTRPSGPAPRASTTS